jgi:hypothetical protein
MKNSLILCIAATALFAVKLPSQAQFGGLVGGLVKKVTAESLTADGFGGLDFFAKAAEQYSNALLPAEEAKKLEADLKSNDKSVVKKAVITASTRLEEVAKEKKAKAEKLSKEAQELVKKGNGEFSKGVAKWVLVGGALALAAKEGAKDAALVAAIPVAQEMIKDLPQLKKMNDAISALSKLK